jgi:hypothetical protein
MWMLTGILTGVQNQVREAAQLPRSRGPAPTVGREPYWIDASLQMYMLCQRYALLVTAVAKQDFRVCDDNTEYIPSSKANVAILIP